MIIKLLKMRDQENILKGAREEWCVTYGGAIWVSVGNSSEIIEARKKGQNIFQVLDDILQWQILIPAKQWKYEGKIKTSSDKGKRIFPSRPTPRELLKGVLHIEKVW